MIENIGPGNSPRYQSLRATQKPLNKRASDWVLVKRSGDEKKKLERKDISRAFYGHNRFNSA